MASRQVGSQTSTMAVPDEDSVANLKTADQLVHHMSRLRTTRMVKERMWKINTAFYRGAQYTFWNPHSKRLESLPIEDGDKPRYRVRIVANAVLSGVQSVLAKLTKTKPVISATPGSGDNNAVRAAQTAEALLEHWWDVLQLDDKLEEAILWSLVACQGYWKISWDPQAGTPMEFLMDPTKQKPVLDESLKTIYHNELKKRGIDPTNFTKTVYMGDIRVEVLSPFDVYPDPTVRTYSEAKWVICRHGMDPDEIQSRWKKVYSPDAIPSTSEIIMQTAEIEGPTRRTLKNVYFGYFLPTALTPRGRYVVWVENPNEILVDSDWPYPTRHLPIVKFSGVRVPGDIYDTSMTQQALPMQKELNRTISQIVEWKNLTIAPQIWAPKGSIRERMTNEPGQINEYIPIGNHKPEPIVPPVLPPYVFTHLADIKQRMDEIFGLTPVAQGQLPPNLEAATAIDILQELAADRFAPIVKLNEKSLAQAGQIMLALAQENYTEPRLMTIKGSGSGQQVKQFTQADIKGGITVKCESGSGLPRLRAARKDQIMAFVKEGLLPADKAWKYLDIADLKAVGQMMMSDEDMALREHEKMLKGIPINVLALEKAKKALAQNPTVNPQTGQPFQGQEEVKDFITSAAYAPLDYENWGAHLDVHGLFMKTIEFENLDTETQENFITHLNQTRERFFSLPHLPKEFKPPNVTLRLDGTVGPTAAAKIIQKTGALSVTPQDLQEPPLETYVRDDAAKDPNFVASNDPVSMAEMQQKMQEMQAQQQQQQMEQQQGQQQMQQQQGQHHVDQTQKLQQLTHADNQHQVDQSQQMQQLAQQAETHQQALHHADEAHSMAMAQQAAQLQMAQQNAQHSAEAHRQKMMLAKKKPNAPSS